MADDQVIREILQEMLETGATPEQMCADQPRLLPEVRRRWHQLRTTRAQLDAVFPATAAHAASAAQSALADPPHLPGYENVTFIGRGGMGVVYKARHTALRRTVAVKMLLPGHYADETDRLLQEAAAVAALQHPNIVQLFDVGTYQGRPYFTMEHLGGGSLAQKCAGAPHPPGEAAALIATLADAVQAAHDAGIVHRDLKPGNILFSSDGVPKVTDFSLARRIVSDPGATLVHPAAGTPSYMPPEQATGGSKRCEPGVDVYALGAILYDLLTGRAPFRADTPMETLRQVMAEEPASPSRINARVPRDLETICLVCLQKDPSRRYPSARALADDVRKFQSGLPITARRAGPLRRTAKWARRRPANAALAAILLLTVVGVTAWSFWAASRRAATLAAVKADLAQITDLSSQGRLTEARGLLTLAAGRLGDQGPTQLHDALNAADRAISLAAEFDALRMQRATSNELKFDREAFGQRYEHTLRAAGVVASDSDTAEQIAARVIASPTRWSIVAGLNDWTLCSTTMDQARRRLDIARIADPHPEWRDKVRDVSNWSQLDVLRQLAASAPVDARSAALAPILSALLLEHGDDPTDYLRRVQAANPADFWTNFQLAEQLDRTAPPEAVGFYRAARALRPDSVAAAVNLGIALNVQGFRDEAKECWNAALALQPKTGAAYFNLSLVALSDRRAKDAQRYAEAAIQNAPTSAQAVLMLGDAHALQGDWGKALALAEQADAMPTADDLIHRLVKGDMQRFERALALLDKYHAPDIHPPVDPQDACDLVDSLLCGGHMASAAAVCEEGVEGADDKIPPTDIAEWHFQCARAAAQASALPDQPDAERKRLRAQALRRLQQFVEVLRARPRTSESIRENRLAVQPLRNDPFLEPVRSQNSLSMLDADEQSRWREYWNDVNAIAVSGQ